MSSLVLHSPIYSGILIYSLKSTGGKEDEAPPFRIKQGFAQVFNRKDTVIPQVSKEYLQEKLRGIRSTIDDLRGSMESKHRNLESEWIKVQLLLKSQMGRIAKLQAIEMDEAPEEPVKAPEKPFSSNQRLSHAQILELGRQQGLVR